MLFTKKFNFKTPHILLLAPENCHGMRTVFAHSAFELLMHNFSSFAFLIRRSPTQIFRWILSFSDLSLTLIGILTTPWPFILSKLQNKNMQQKLFAKSTFFNTQKKFFTRKFIMTHSHSWPFKHYKPHLRFSTNQTKKTKNKQTNFQK